MKVNRNGLYMTMTFSPFIMVSTIRAYHKKGFMSAIKTFNSILKVNVFLWMYKHCKWFRKHIQKRMDRTMILAMDVVLLGKIDAAVEEIKISRPDLYEKIMTQSNEVDT